MTPTDWHYVTGLGGPLTVNYRDAERAAAMRRDVNHAWRLMLRLLSMLKEGGKQ